MLNNWIGKYYIDFRGNSDGGRLVCSLIEGFWGRIPFRGRLFADQVETIFE